MTQIGNGVSSRKGKPMGRRQLEKEPRKELTGSQRSALKKRAPFVEMVKKGKNQTEAMLFAVISGLLDGEHFEEDDKFWESDLTDDEKGRLNSLIYNADYVSKALNHVDNPDAFFFEPILGCRMKELRSKRIELSLIEGLVQDLLRTRPKIRNKRKELLCDIREEERRVFLIIGFCLGLRSYKKTVRDHLDNLGLKVFEEFTVEVSPTKEKPQRRAAA